MGSPNQTLPISAAALREVDIVGTFRYADTYPAAISFLSAKTLNSLDLNKLVTHAFRGLSNVESAFHMASKTHDERGRLVLKVMITDGESH